MFSLSYDVREAQQQVQGIMQALDRQKPAMLADIGQYLVTEAHQDFLVKSLGGTGDDGVRWMALAPGEAIVKERIGKPLIGIRSGELAALNSWRMTIGGATAWGKHLGRDQLVIENTDQPKANYFNFHRPMLPERLPNAWYRHSESLAAEHLDRL